MKMRVVFPTLIVCLSLPLVSPGDVSAIETGQPETGQPEGSDPVLVYGAGGASAIETGQPETGQPETGQAETGQPGIPIAQDRVSEGLGQGECLQRILDYLESEKPLIERDIASSRSASVSRDSLLLMIGRSSAAHGRFRKSAAAYALSLDAFGVSHARSSRVAELLVESLAPLDLSSISILHTAEGPRYKPTWRMNCETDRQGLIHAVLAGEFAMDVASSPEARGRILLRMGWVHRALDDWQASTDAWMRCAAESKSRATAADARWLIAQNLTWTGQPAAAAKQLRLFAETYPGDGRAKGATERALLLDVEAARHPEWSKNPVHSLQEEIRLYQDRLHPRVLYQSALSRLRKNGDVDARIALGRWAVSQADWKVEHRISAFHNLVDSLLEQPSPQRRIEAVESLTTLIDLAPSPAWSVPAALKCSRLLSESGEFEAADEILNKIEVRAASARSWHPLIAAERIHSILDRGDLVQAEALLIEFKQTWPEYTSSSEFKSLSRLIAIRKEGE